MTIKYNLFIDISLLLSTKIVIEILIKYSYLVEKYLLSNDTIQIDFYLNKFKV